MGAKTLAIDASSSNIKIASAHASEDPFLTPRSSAVEPPPLEYRHTTSDTLIEEGKTFDVVTSMEVVEHVDNPADFLRSCAALVKVRPFSRISAFETDVSEPVVQPGGHLFLSTVARTPLSYFLTIFMAEQALKLVTPGTHTWSKYINADEMHAFFRDDLKWFPQHGASRPSLDLPFFVLTRAAYRSTEQHYRDPGNILQPPHLEMEFNTPRHSWRIGRQLYLLDTPALHSLMSAASTVTDLTLNHFVRKHRFTAKYSLSRPVLVSFRQFDGLLHSHRKAVHFSKPPSIETQGMKIVQPSEQS